jgi:N6-L-threonylcarbamoyladenine synthase
VPWVGIMANHMRVATLGLDTSCYTTSAALVIGGILAYDGRAPLQVSKGHVGLRQSEALFQHVRNLPRLIEAACDGARRESCDIVAVAASAWPRRVEGSYMPVFLASAGYGRALAAALGVPFLETSHQEGHVAAARWSSGLKPDGGYLALHLSGGTTELLSVKSRFQLELLGATDDLNAGQFVDRVGVALGLSFPAGPDLERLAGGGEPGRVSLPVAVRGLRVSFSGPCSAAMREIDSGARPAVATSNEYSSLPCCLRIVHSTEASMPTPAILRTKSSPTVRPSFSHHLRVPCQSSAIATMPPMRNPITDQRR